MIRHPGATRALLAAIVVDWKLVSQRSPAASVETSRHARLPLGWQMTAASGSRLPAPIGLSVYKRIDHVRKTVEALQANTLASASPLYIFSDAASPGDEDMVQAVREYARTIDGFKTVSLIERKRNSRVLNNRGGIKQLLDTYGRIIFLEEDIATAPGFLAFMNSALDFYASDARILSITGYGPPLGVPAENTGDTYILRRFNAWGFATWADRLDPFELDVDVGAVKKLLLSPGRLREFIGCGEDMLRLLLAEAGGELDALDVKLMYRQFLGDTYTVYPTISLVQNTGHDGSGTHCSASEKFNVSLWNKLDGFDFQLNPVTDAVINRENYRFRRLSNRERVRLFNKCVKFLVKS